MGEGPITVLRPYACDDCGSVFKAVIVAEYAADIAPPHLPAGWLRVSKYEGDGVQIMFYCPECKEKH